jgi:hypothetical protein
MDLSHSRSKPHRFQDRLAPDRSGVGAYLEHEGGSSLDVRLWLLAVSGLVLLGALSWGLRLLLRSFFSLSA